jgi:hypothetical protein
MVTRATLMSDSIIFKRPKSKPVQRLRQASPELADGKDGERGDSPSAVATRLKKRDKSKTKLSFLGRDEATYPPLDPNPVHPPLQLNGKQSLNYTDNHTPPDFKSESDGRYTLTASSDTDQDHTKDFISLAVTRRSDEYQGPHPESRLVREGDELGEGDDGDRPLSSTKCV